MPWETELQIALHAVRAASELCKTVQSTLVTQETIEKKDRSPVTVADYGSQAAVTLTLMSEFPDCQIIGEEDAAALRDPANASLKERVIELVGQAVRNTDENVILAAIDRGNAEGGDKGLFWTIDPIDGTKGFLRGEQYAVALALIENGEVQLGVLGCPNMPLDHENPDAGTGCLFYAVKGQGAFQAPLDGSAGPRAILVSKLEYANQATFCEPVESGHSSHGHSEQIAKRLGVTKPPVRLDSQAKYAVVARAEASMYLRLPTRADYEEKIWDHAAGSIIVKEAGGSVADLDNRPLDFSLGRTLKNNRGLIVTNGLLQLEVQDAAQVAFDN